MKTILLHGLGQTAQDWNEVVRCMAGSAVECPELFSVSGNECSYARILENLEQQYADAEEPLRLCGLSLGAILALDFTIRHRKKVGALVCIGAQYKVPRLLLDVQTLLFRCMPHRVFADMGMAREDILKLSRSMRNLDLTPRLKEIHCPVTIMCGEKDWANRKAAAKLQVLLPQAKLQILSGVGHEVNREAPQVLADMLLSAE